jgi:hypothetical protein
MLLKQSGSRRKTNVQNSGLRWNGCNEPMYRLDLSRRRLRHDHHHHRRCPRRRKELLNLDHLRLDIAYERSLVMAKKIP